MKENRSLALTTEITKCLESDLTNVFEDLFPFEKIAALRPKNVRDRVFSPENTLLTMLLSMVNEDRSLQNALSIYSVIHERTQKKIQKQHTEFAKNLRNNPEKKAGRPRKNPEWIAASKQKPISESTSAYTQARNRLPIEMVTAIFESSIAESGQFTWHDRPVFIAGGTYVQLQDIPAILEQFPKQKKTGFPQGMLSVIIQQGNGSIYDYHLSSHTQNEFEMLRGILPSLPSGSILLADELYNSFAAFSHLHSQGVDIIVHCNKNHKYEKLKSYGIGDELVRITSSTSPNWLNGKELEHKTLDMRRIEYTYPDLENGKKVIFTSLIDEKISSHEIILKYNNRWDLELSISEIKNIMDLKVLRSKTPEMLEKELCIGLTAYNYVRKIMVNAPEISDITAENELIDRYYELNKPILLDKRGRRFARWSPGRYGSDKK